MLCPALLLSILTLTSRVGGSLLQNLTSEGGLLGTGGLTEKGGLTELLQYTKIMGTSNLIEINLAVTKCWRLVFLLHIDKCQFTSSALQHFSQTPVSLHKCIHIHVNRC